MKDTLAFVRALVAEFQGPAADDAPLDLDSFTIVLLVEALEDRHRVKLNTQDVTPANFATITTLARLVAAAPPL